MAADIGAKAEALAARVRSLRPGNVHRPVLVYFDIVGICWPIRCLLHLRDVDYELVQIPAAVWAYRDAEGQQVLPACFRNDRMPLYVDPEVSLSQSTVIMTYLAEKHDLFGDSVAERLAAMEVMAHAYDALFHWGGLFQVNLRMNTPDDVAAHPTVGRAADQPGDTGQPDPAGGSFLTCTPALSSAPIRARSARGACQRNKRLRSEPVAYNPVSVLTLAGSEAQSAAEDVRFARRPHPFDAGVFNQWRYQHESRGWMLLRRGALCCRRRTNPARSVSLP